MTTEEIKAAQEKLEQEKKAALEAEAAKNKPTIKEGMVSISEQDYNNLVNMKSDMTTYKEEKRKLAAELEVKIAAELKAKEEQLVADGKLKELIEIKDKEISDMRADFKDQKITSALMVKLIEAGVKSEYVKLVDKSKVIMDKDSGEISGVDEIIESFVKDHPELVKEGDNTKVDTSKGGSKSGTMSDDDLRKLNGAERMKIKETDPVLYARIRELASQGRQN